MLCRYSDKHRTDIRRHILEFGKLATDHAPSLLLPNLHKLACFAHIQEANCGLLGHNNELWGERALLPLKSCARNAKRDPDMVVANTILVQLAKATLQIRFNRNCLEETATGVDGRSSSVDVNVNVDMCSESRPLSSQGGPTDNSNVHPDLSTVRSDFPVDYGVQGKGRDASSRERRSVCGALKQLVRSDADVLRMLAVSYDELIPGNNDLVISIHSYAYIHHTQTITSSIFERSQTRDGSVVQVRFDGKKFAGRVQYYATIQRNSLPECEVTIALCKFYANAVEIGSSAFGTMLFCPKVNNDHEGPWTADSKEEGYPVLLDCIDTKYTMLKISGKEDFHKLMFVTYKFQSNLY